MDIIKTAKPPLQGRVEAYELDDLSHRFDDLRSALEYANDYFKTEDKPPDDIVQFFKETTEVEGAIRKAISSLGSTNEKKRVKESIDTYNNALGGLPFTGKFLKRWKNICGRKVRRFLIINSKYLMFCLLRKGLIGSFSNDDGDIEHRTTNLFFFS